MGKPTVCYLNSNDFDGDIEEVNGVYLKPASYIQPNYFWIGVEQEATRAEAA